MPLWRRLAWKLGYDLRPLRKSREPMAQLTRLLARNRIDGVLDVGANIGQYATALREWGYRGPILSFEPLPEPHAALLRRARSDPAWDVAPPMALGDAEAEVELEVSEESDMSSILPQSPLLRSISPSSEVRRRLKVPQHRLDRLETVVDRPWRRLHLKADVQGFEPRVLEGARGLLDRILSVQLELALVRLYEGEEDWRAMVERLAEAGFEVHLVLPGYFERKLARQLQFDAVFVRRSDADRDPGGQPSTSRSCGA